MAYTISELGPPKGFHPISSTRIYLPGPHKSYEFCTLHLHHTLPPLVFVDTHELAQRNESYTFNHWGSRDLEKPAHALPDEVSELLLNIRLPDLGTESGHPLHEEEQDKGEGRTVHVEVPMHLRYGAPRTASSSSSSEKEQAEAYERIRVDWPQGFLSCPSTCNVDVSSQYHVPYISKMLCTARAITKKGNNASLPKHILSVLPSDKILVAIPPHPDSSDIHSILYLPVGNRKDLAFVEPLTAFTILACCFWLFKVAKKTAQNLNAKTQPTPHPKAS